MSFLLLVGVLGLFCLWLGDGLPVALDMYGSSYFGYFYVWTVSLP